jgi:uncharacterized protein DUF4260
MSDTSQSASEPDSKMVYHLLRIEGLILLIGSIIVAIYFKYAWWLYLGLFFAADLTMLAYKKNNRIGAILYNLTHTISIPLVFLIIGIIFDLNLLVSIMVIIFGHIGYDRMNGFGLKYPSGINDTHLHRLAPWMKENNLNSDDELKKNQKKI